DIKRAEKLYDAINKGKFRGRNFYLGAANVVLAVVLAIAAALYFSGFAGLSELLILAALIGYVAWANFSKKNALDSVKMLLANSFRHELAVKTFTDDEPAIGELKVAVMSSKA